MFEIVLRNRSFFIRKNFSTKNKVILYDALQNLKYSKIAEFPRYKRSPEPLQMLRHILRKRKYNIILCKEKKGYEKYCYTENQNHEILGVGEEVHLINPG